METDYDFYKKASNEWLRNKIRVEHTSIRINKKMIEMAKEDIHLCERILKERQCDK